MRVTIEELRTQLEELLQHPAPVTELATLLEEAQPFDLAEAVSQLPEEHALLVLTAVESSLAAEVLEHLEYVDQYRLLHHMEQAAAQRILDQMSSNAVADLIGAIHPRQAEQMLTLLPAEYVTTIRALMQYPENSAGGRMKVDYISARQYMTAEQVLAHVRKVGREADTVSYIYVVDAAGRLVGVVSLRELILASPRERVSAFMNSNVVSVPAAMDQEEMASIVSKYDLIAIPVVASDNRLLGIITVDDVIDVLQEEATEDVYRMGATSVPDEVTGLGFVRSAWALAKPRLPWLIGLLFMELGTGVIIKTFEGVVTATVAGMLAAFTIVITGESGNAATQALAVAVRGLATGEIKGREIRRVVLREALVGVMVGAIAGSTLMLIGAVFEQNLLFGVAIGIALAVNLFLAKIMGTVFPIVIHRFGVDPAVASGPFITTLTDNTSVFIYYGVAAIILRSLA